MEKPAPMFNHHRGLWGYSGAAADGSGPLMVQGTGRGGPSLTAVVTDLALLGVDRMIRLGTAVSPSLTCGTAVVATSAGSLGLAVHLAPDAQLTARAAAVIPSATAGHVISAGVHLAPTRDGIPQNAIAADLSTASLYSAAAELGFATLSILLVTETHNSVTTDDELEELVKAIAKPALSLLN